MGSIKTKICTLVIATSAVTAIAINTISVISATQLIESDSSQIMNDVCRNATLEFDAALSRIEQAVNTMAFYIDNNLNDFERFKESDDYVNEFTDGLQPLMRAAARNTDSIACAYVRYNPDFTDPESGIFLSRSNLNSPFEMLTPTDFSMYDPTDLEHVGWYYIPVNNGAPTWMEPYYNANIDMNLVSYVIPLSKNGESVGIVGMDIDFSLFESLTQSDSVYGNATALLISNDNDTILFGSGAENGGKLSTLDETGSSSELLAAIASSADSEGGLYRITIAGTQMYASFRELSNGMALITAVSENDINRTRNNLFMMSGISSLVIIALGTAVALLVSHNIVKPLRKLNSSVQKIADGSLDVTIDVHTNDEVGTLASSFSSTTIRLHEYVDYIDEISNILNDIANGNLDFALTKSYEGSFMSVKISLLNISDTLNKVIGDINKVSEQVALKSGEIASGAQSLAQNSTEQTNSIGSLSEAIENLTKDIEGNNENIHRALESVEYAVSGIRESTSDMDEMRAAMAAISDVSGEIRSIVETVDSIASQTGILAVNAAIEAARAGEAGRGFAVVASEIQNLSTKTTAATKNISELVNKVVETVTNGASITNKTGESLERVSGVSDEIENSLQSIAGSSEEQAKAVERINDGVAQISAAVQNNSATSQESAAASEEMSAQAKLLHERVSAFKLKK